MKHLMKHLRIILSLSFVFLFLFGSQTMVSAQEALRMYTSLDPNEAKVYIEAFTKDTGIKVDWVRMSAGEVLARIKAEAKNPQVSISYGGPSVEYIAAKKEGLLVPYKSPVGAPFLKGNLKDPQDFWTGFYFGAIGFGNNTTWFEKNKVPLPTSWQDLLRPELKANISIAYPYTSGTSYTTLATLVAGSSRTLFELAGCLGIGYERSFCPSPVAHAREPSDSAASCALGDDGLRRGEFVPVHRARATLRGSAPGQGRIDSRCRRSGG